MTGPDALRAARDNRLQTSLNLALGSALASIGLTIPAVAVVSILLDVPLTLGLVPKDTVLLALTLIAGVVTLGTGRTTMLQGGGPPGHPGGIPIPVGGAVSHRSASVQVGAG